MDFYGEYSEKNVVMYRDDELGFGMRVGGQYPVFVDQVLEDGAAWRAGVRKDDIIIMVDGMLVDHLEHREVVEIICCRDVVHLTLHSPEPVYTSSNSSCG